MTAPTESEVTAERRVPVQMLYDRSRASGIELFKHLSTLATAGVGVFFVALSTKVDPPLTAAQRQAVTVALVCFLLTLFGTVMGWIADATFYEMWARVLDGKAPERNWRIRERANRIRTILMYVVILLFLVGGIAAGRYVYLRVVSVS